MQYSVAIATYNGSKYIEAQLNSILKQTIKPSEIIIYDDCSIDNTVEIVKHYISEGSPVKLYNNQKNMGYGLTFMKAIEACSCNYIFLSDQDDYWFVNKAESMSCLISENKNNICWIHDCSICDNDLKPIIKSKIQNIKRSLHNKNSYVMGACMVLSKEIKSIVFPYPGNLKYYGHDNWIAFACKSIDKMTVSEEILLFYRRHKNSTSITDFNSIYKGRIKLILSRIFKRNKIQKQTRRRNLIWSIQLMKNIAQKNHKINIKYNVETSKIAMRIGKVNILLRLIIILKLMTRGYYSTRSNLFSIISDLLNLD
tara:strand:- start:882 stop:1817 length:936 start_codon:yes stop_codon:yes gene_type:complete